jgi:hypothetical protein
VIPLPQLKVYKGVPPDGVKLIVPFDPPKQETLVTTVVPETGEVGCVTVAFTVPVHPFRSVI